MIVLRPYKETDGPMVVKWLKDEKSFYQWSAGRLGTYPPGENLLNEYKKDIESNDSIYQFVACEDSVPVGYLIMRYPEEDRRKLRFGFVVVDNERRGQGIGCRMLESALVYAFDVLRVEKVTIGVFENNPQAYSCYIRAGFHEVKGQVYNAPILGQEWPCMEMEIYSKSMTWESKDANISQENIVNNIIQKNDFRYAFQPIVSAASGEIVAYEALMRAEADGPVSPIAILEAAKKAGRLYDIEKSTFFNILGIMKRRLAEFGERQVYINSIPGYMLSAQDYGELKEKYQELFKQIIVEITEETELSDKELYELLRRSTQSGFGLAIDDYGTGYSNTTNLLRYLPNCVKIDRLLIADIHQDQKKQHFVKSLVEFAHENGFKALAEGVETSAELKCMIQFGVDLIQGYYTGRPTFEILQGINPVIKNEIINANVRGQTQESRKIYTVEEETELPLMRVALEKNTGMLISSPEFKLVGNSNYMASMNIKIKDGSESKLILHDVLLESFQDMPCIELGENVKATLVLEGNNALRKVGICVPASSSLQIVGSGNLNIQVKGIQSYGIGNLWDAMVGDIQWACGGLLEINAEAEYAVAIGGGTFAGQKGLSLLAGTAKVELFCGNAIGVGCVRGKAPIEISGMSCDFVLNIGTGVGIGALEESTDIIVGSSTLQIVGAGSCIAGIGSIQEVDTNVKFKYSTVNVTMNGQKMYLCGVDQGDFSIIARNSTFNLHGEGSEVLGIGSRGGDGSIEMKDVDCNIDIRSGGYMLFGAKDENCSFIGGTQSFKANE